MAACGMFTYTKYAVSMCLFSDCFVNPKQTRTSLRDGDFCWPGVIGLNFLNKAMLDDDGDVSKGDAGVITRGEFN